MTSYDICLCRWWTEIGDCEMKAKGRIARMLECGRPCTDLERRGRCEGRRNCVCARRAWKMSSVCSVSVRVFCGKAGRGRGCEVAI